MEIVKTIFDDQFFYQFYFQNSGDAELELDADVLTSLRKIYYWFSGEGLRAKPSKYKPADAKLFDGMDDPIDLPPWMINVDLDYYVSQFTQYGFRGSLNRYRNQYMDFENFFFCPIGIKKTLQPTDFIAGTLEPVLIFVPGVDLVANMRKRLEDLRFFQMLQGVGHWV